MPGANELRQAEAQALSGSTGFYSGSGKAPKAQTKLSGKKGKYGALGLTLAIMLGAGVWLGSSNSLILGALSSQLPTVTQTDAASSNTVRILSLSNMLKKKTATGYVKDRFAKNNIIPNSDGTFTWNGQTVDGDNFTSLYNNDATFRNSVDKATFSKVANRYDTIANDAITSRTGYNTRNIYRDYKDSGDNETNTKRVNEIVDAQFDNKYTTDMADTKSSISEEIEYDDEGNAVGKTYELNTEKVEPGAAHTTSDTTTARTQAHSIISSLSESASRYINFGCTALELGSMIATTIASVNTYQAIKFYWTNMEPVDKTIAGHGEASGINVLLNRFTSNETITRSDPSNVQYDANSSIGSDGMDGNKLSTTAEAGNLTINATEVTETGSALDDPNLTAMLSGLSFNRQAASSYSLEASLKSLFAALGVFGISRAACAKLGATIAGINLAVPVVALAVSLIPGGAIVVSGAMVWNQLKSALSSIVLGATVSFAMSGILAFLIPELERSITNPMTGAVGKAFGAYMARSSGAANSSLAQIGSGATAAGSNAILAYQQVQKDYIAKQAEVDRLNHSPFDITNKNTFLGSIAYSLLPAITSSKSSSTISTILKTTSSSIANITGSAIAEGEGTEYINTFGDCPSIESVGGKGDVFCNVIAVHDVSVLHSTFDNDPIYKQVVQESLDYSGDSHSVIKYSDLDKFTISCTERTAPIGVFDSKVYDYLQRGNALANAAPGSGEVLDIINGINEPENSDWATGAYCVNNAENVDQSEELRRFWNEKGKYYSHFIQSERTDEQLGGPRSSISVRREEYRRENPIEQTPAGILASISGLSTEKAQLVLDILAYYEFIENYDPSTRIAMNESITPTSTDIVNKLSSNNISFQSENTQLTEVFNFEQHYIIYADTRNRSYTV